MVLYVVMNPEKNPSSDRLENLNSQEKSQPEDISGIVNVVIQEEVVVDTNKRKEQDIVAIAETREQLGLAPENVEKSLEKRTELSSVSLKEKLLDSLEPVFNSIGISTIGDLWNKTTKEITNKYENLKDLSNEAGDFFKELIPQGIKKPEVAGQGRHSFTTNVLINKDQEAFSSHGPINRKVLRGNLEKFFEESIFRKERKPYESELTEADTADWLIKGNVHEAKNSRNNQEITRAMNQKGGENIIYEHIENDIYYSNNSRRTRANLVFQDIKSGIALDLDALLPANFHFEPGVENLDLKTYSGAIKSEGEFFERARREVVAYGNITEKGGMLSLLHEIAHSWQANYSEDTLKGKYTYKKLLGESYQLMQELELASFNQDPSEAREKINEIIGKLSAIGTAPYLIDNQDSIATKTPIHEDGVINLQGTFNAASVDYIDSLEVPQAIKESLKVKKYYTIKNSKLEKAREEYIAEERDAWAHALRMMRFLRQNGLDIEPEFKKLADIKEHVDPCLGSYQKGLEQDIKLAPDDYRFSRLPQG